MIRLIVLLLVCVVTTGFAIGDVERGNRLYRAGRYAEAVEAYEAALAAGRSTPELHYNLGTAFLALQQYDRAEQHFREALGAASPELRASTYFNLGNRFLVAGRGAAEAEQKTALLDAAVEAYKHALRAQPDAPDAKWNLELALRERDEQESSGGGGGGDPQNDSGDQDTPQGGGAGEDPSQGSSSDAEPTPAEQRQAPLSPEQAERILSAAEQDERELYRAKLRRGRRELPVARDW